MKIKDEVKQWGLHKNVFVIITQVQLHNKLENISRVQIEKVAEWKMFKTPAKFNNLSDLIKILLKI